MIAGTPGHATDDAVLAEARRIVLGLAGGMIFTVLAAAFVPSETSSSLLVVPAAVLGIVSPVIGYRLFHLMREKTAADAAPVTRRARYLRATVLGLAATEGAAFVGVVAFWMSGELQSLIGVASHAILTGALWPTPEKLDGFGSGGVDA